MLRLVALSLLGALPAAAQANDELKALKKDIEELKAGQKAIQQELAVIRSLLLARQPAPPQPPQEVVVSVEGAPFLGEKNAKLTLVEFSDYQCPYCARHFSQTLPQLMTDYVKTGKVKYVLRDYPLETLHPLAFKAAEAARCASEQGKYWEMHDRLMANQKAQEPKDFPNHAQALGLDAKAFQQCLDSGKQAAKVRQDIAEGDKAGVDGTPTFFLGLTDAKSSQIRATRKIGGAVPYPNFKQAIESLLASPPTPSR